jgi:hypothetical protein
MNETLIKLVDIILGIWRFFFIPSWPSFKLSIQFFACLILEEECLE